MMNFDDLKTPGKTIGWDFIVLMSRQGKIRLAEFFSSYTESDKRRILRDIAADVLPRAPKMCNIIEKGEFKFVYRRYASLYFVVGVPSEGTNELIVLEQIHLFVEVSCIRSFGAFPCGVGRMMVVSERRAVSERRSGTWVRGAQIYVHCNAWVVIARVKFLPRWFIGDDQHECFWCRSDFSSSFEMNQILFCLYLVANPFSSTF